MLGKGPLNNVIGIGELFLLVQHGSENLDQSFLHFFEQFRVVYVGDVVSKTAGVRAHT